MSELGKVKGVYVALHYDRDEGNTCMFMSLNQLCVIRLLNLRPNPFKPPILRAINIRTSVLHLLQPSHKFFAYVGPGG